MKDAGDYLAQLHSLIVSNPNIQHWNILREEVQGNIGLFRYRLTLNNGTLSNFLNGLKLPIDSWTELNIVFTGNKPPDN